MSCSINKYSYGPLRTPHQYNKWRPMQLDTHSLNKFCTIFTNIPGKPSLPTQVLL